MPTAIVMTAPHKPLERWDVPEPALAPGGVLLETLYSEVCGTDVHLWHGRLAGVPYPIIPGHVSVGRIAELAGAVNDVDGQPFAVGDVVAFLDVHGSCGECFYCTVAKASTRCPQRRVYGITFSAEEGLLGGWATHIALRPSTRLLRLPADLPAETYIGGGCGANTALHAVQRAEVAFDDTVVVLGAGPVGLSCVAFARIAGAGRIICVGAPAARLSLAQAMGADDTIDFTAVSDVKGAIAALSRGRGADVVIEAAGAPAAVTTALAAVRDQGRVVVCGQYTDNGAIALNPHLDLNRKHIDVRACWGSDFSHFYRAIAVMGRHHTRFPWHALASRRYPLQRAQEALEDVAAARVAKAVIAPAG